MNIFHPVVSLIKTESTFTIGVTAAIKAFSLSNNEHDEMPNVVMDNSKTVVKRINRITEFAILVKAERVGQSINTPIVKVDSVFIRETTG